jgi:hypothetical protein
VIAMRILPIILTVMLFASSAFARNPYAKCHTNSAGATVCNNPGDAGSNAAWTSETGHKHGRHEGAAKTKWNSKGQAKAAKNQRSVSADADSTRIQRAKAGNLQPGGRP